MTVYVLSASCLHLVPPRTPPALSGDVAQRVPRAPLPAAPLQRGGDALCRCEDVGVRGKRRQCYLALSMSLTVDVSPSSAMGFPGTADGDVRAGEVSRRQLAALRMSGLRGAHTRLCETSFRGGNENLGVRSLAVRPRNQKARARCLAVSAGAWCSA